MRATVTRWLGPSLVVIAVLLLYRFVVADMLDDWVFLHTARMQTIQRELQRQSQPKPQPQP